MFGKRAGAAAPIAPPPAPAGGAEISTRPQRVEPAQAQRPEPRPQAPAAAPAPAGGQAPMKRAQTAGPAGGGPKATPGLEQLRAAQSGVASTSGVVTQIVRE